MNRHWLICLALAATLVAFWPGEAQAAGTASGTTVSNVALLKWTSGQQSSETTTLTTDTTVGRVAGDTLTDPGNSTFDPGETLTYTYQIYNSGNATDSFRVYVDTFLLSGNAKNWYFILTVGANTTSTLNDTKTTATVAAGSYTTCSVTVHAWSNTDSSPDGSSGQFRMRIVQWNAVTADSTGQYTGDNGTTYAQGDAGGFDTSLATVTSAVITLSKSIRRFSVGGETKAVLIPGATIEYELTYNNIGSGTADSVIIRDTIPANTVFDTASYSSETFGASASFAENDSGTSGWELQLTTAASPTHTYNSNDFQKMANIAYANRSAVTVVRWVRQQVLSGQTATVRFRVIVQ